jgi:hypothetical protein
MERIIAWLLQHELNAYRRRQSLLAERARLLNAWRDQRRLRRCCGDH